MNLGIIDGNITELDQVWNNFKNDYSLEYEEISNLEDLQTKDAVLIFRNEESNVRKICENIIRIKQMNVPIWIVTKEIENQEYFIYVQLGVCGIYGNDFSIEDILMMVNNTLQYRDRESNPVNNHVATKHFIKINQSKSSISIDKKNIFLTKTEFLIVDYLYKNQNTVCTYEEIINELLKTNSVKKIEKVYLANLVFRIRKKMVKILNGEHEIIQNIRSVGYMMNSVG
ncbi:hypothetical protein GIX45_10460 [Erwinia sp. CPCC 100877]|nr:hypothetical protein [Erwinia sp. CPCC 100877]